MRVIVVVWFAVLAFAQAALAADLGPYLRGPQYEEPVPAYRWSGVYGGGQVGFSVSGVDFSGGVGDLVAHILRVTAIEQDQHISNLPLLRKRNPTGVSFGGFAGYNWQWEDAVVGIELNYNRTSLSGEVGDTLERVFIDNAQAPPGHNFQYDVTVTGSARAHITDFGTFRARGGWAAGPFLPYAFAAIAVRRADVVRTATVQYTITDFPNQGGPPRSSFRLRRSDPSPNRMSARVLSRSAAPQASASTLRSCPTSSGAPSGNGCNSLHSRAI